MGDSTNRPQSHRNYRRGAGNLVTRAYQCCALILLFIFAAGLTGCTQKSGIDVDMPGVGKTRLNPGETLRVNLLTEPPGLDWQKAADTTSATVTANIMQGLTQYDFSGPTITLRPGLALKWETVGDAHKWKITLRDGVKWSDGVPFTAQHVVDGWRRLLAKETAAEYAYFLFSIKNAKDFNDGKKTWDDVGVKITAPNELTVELERPIGYFPFFLTHHSTFPIRLDVIEKYRDRWTDPGHLVTLGPFNLRVWSHDRLMVLERSPTYYGQPALLKYVVIYMINEPSTAINLFDSGRLDAVHALPSVELKKQRSRPEYVETPRLTSYYYGMNVTNPPLNNVFVRRALARAIDRKELVKMLDGGQVPLSGWIPKGMLGNEPDSGLQFDPAKARELLKEGGFAKPEDVPLIEIKFNTNDDHSRIAENIQAQLKRNLGIRVELKNEEWKIFLNELHTKPPDIFRMGWQADYPDPDNFMSLMTASSDNNYTRWKNPEFDRVVTEASAKVDPAERSKLYKEATRILTEQDAPVIPLFSAVDHSLISPRAKHYPMNALDMLDYSGVSLK